MTETSLNRYTCWLTEAALPFWAERGFEADAERFHERLDANAVAIEVPLRSMVQARQIYVFADAASRGWLPEGGQLAERAMRSLLRTYSESSGNLISFAFAADPRGSIISPVRDAYGHAFILFALAALFRLTGDPHLLVIADQLIGFLDREMADCRHGGYHDALPPGPATKRQNPHMHLFEAYLFMDEAAPGRGYIERAGAIVALFRDRMLHRPSGCLPEYFQTNWTNLSSEARGMVWEPGHHFEWAWLLERYARRGGSHTGEGVALYAKAKAHGLSPSGRLLDELAYDDMRVLKPSSRIWPHTEAIKAALRVSQGRESYEANFAEQMAATLLADFLDRPFAGGWTDHLAPDGAPLVDYVPASTLYHLHMAATEIASVKEAKSLEG